MIHAEYSTLPVGAGLAWRPLVFITHQEDRSMHGLLVGGLSLTVTGALLPLALGDPEAGALALFALALWLGAAVLALLLWVRSAPPRPPLLFSVPVCREPVATPGSLPVDVRCYDENGAVTFLVAELIPPPAVG